MIEFFTSSTFRTVLSALNSGFLKTLQLFFITLIGALPLGLVISFGSMSRFPPLRWLTRLVVWVIRGTPLVLQIIALFYVPGIQKWFNWPSGESGRMMAVCVAFIINYACYFSEIYRGGIQGVPKGQQEAGQVLGMTKAQIFRHITLLQMIKRIVPPISNEIITLVKDTSLARVIALQEVIWMGESFMKGNSGIAGLVWPLFFTAVYYLIFSGVVTLLLGQLEKKMESPDFWENPEEYQEVTKEVKALRDTLEAMEGLSGHFEDVILLIEMADEENDRSMLKEIEREISSFEEKYEALRIETLLSGEYDKNSAIVTLHAGAGGTESCDWANMLYRMYTRWSAEGIFHYCTGLSGRRYYRNQSDYL